MTQGVAKGVSKITFHPGIVHVFTLLFCTRAGKKVQEQRRLLKGTLKTSWFLLFLELLYVKGVGERVWLGFLDREAGVVVFGVAGLEAASAELRAPWPVPHASSRVLIR